MRIVSLLPSATEIVCALDAGNELVGRSEECDYPTSVRTLPVVMRARTLDSTSPPASIDRRVRAQRVRGESLYELDLPHLRALNPEVIFTQDLCRVCSVTEDEVKSACAQADLSPQIVSVSPRALDDVWRSVETIGRAIDRRDEAQKLARQLRQRSSSLSMHPKRSARVAVVEWLDPAILAGLWTPEMIRRAGGEPVLGNLLGPTTRTTWRELAAVGCNLLILSPCSFPVSRTIHELRDPDLALSVDSIHPSHGTWIADEAYFSRPGPRLADGIELLRGLLSGKATGGPMPVVRWPTEVAAS